MVHPLWESVRTLVINACITHRGEEREEFDWKYRLGLAISDQEMRKIRRMKRACDWALRLGIFTEMSAFLEHLSKACNNRVTQEAINTRHWVKNKMRRDGKLLSDSAVWTKKKCPHNEDTILSQIWDYDPQALPVANSKISGFIPKIGIELEVEDGVRSNPRKGWDNKSDGSLGYSGREYVSPPLSLDEGMVQFREVIDYLRPKGCRGAQTTGLHFHVGYDPKKCSDNPWKDQELREKEQVILDFIKSKQGDPEFSLVFPNNRYHNSYCQLTPSTSHSRYHAVNFHAMSEHKTIEIRFPGVCPNLSPEWADQFEKVVRFCYDVLDGVFTFVNPVQYTGPVTYPIRDAMIYSPFWDTYWGEFFDISFRYNL